MDHSDPIHFPPQFHSRIVVRFSGKSGASTGVAGVETAVAVCVPAGATVVTAVVSGHVEDTPSSGEVVAAVTAGFADAVLAAACVVLAGVVSTCVDAPIANPPVIRLINTTPFAMPLLPVHHAEELGANTRTKR